MSVYRIQGREEKLQHVFYEFNSDTRPLGEGGMGKVFRGRCVNEKNGNVRDVAIKFMYSDLPSYAIEKARREAAIQFRHDNLVEMLGFIDMESKTPLGEVEHHYHVVSELLEGVSLDALFNGRLVDQQGVMVPYADKLYKDYQNDVCRFSVTIIKNILSGLITMHDAGYIHRDIDPTNIMITRNGKIKLIDFGIAKKMNSLTTHDKHLTQAGQFVGKPEYAAPELVLGAINEQNQTTDIYAVGILLFQCVVGHVPFEGDRSDVLQKQLHSPLPLKLVKHKGLRKIIAKATDKSRAKRYQSAAEFRVALDNLNNGGGGGWKPLYTFIMGVAAVACIVFAIIVSIGGKEEENDLVVPDTTEVLIDNVPVITNDEQYSQVIKALHSSVKEDRIKGLQKLRVLSDEGCSEASLLLFRLYFESTFKMDVTHDSIKHMRFRLEIPVNNIVAHDYLALAVEQDSENYEALYELACDYWLADQRTQAVSDRDGDKAERYFNDTKRFAEMAGASDYVEKANKYLKSVEEWKRHINKLKK